MVLYFITYMDDLTKVDQLPTELRIEILLNLNTEALFGLYDTPLWPGVQAIMESLAKQHKVKDPIAALWAFHTCENPPIIKWHRNGALQSVQTDGARHLVWYTLKNMNYLIPETLQMCSWYSNGALHKVKRINNAWSLWRRSGLQHARYRQNRLSVWDSHGSLSSITSWPEPGITVHNEYLSAGAIDYKYQQTLIGANVSVGQILRGDDQIKYRHVEGKIFQTNYDKWGRIIRTFDENNICGISTVYYTIYHHAPCDGQCVVMRSYLDPRCRCKTPLTINYERSVDNDYPCICACPGRTTFLAGPPKIEEGRYFVI